MRARTRAVLVLAGVLLVLAAAASPWIVAAYWRFRSDNPVRRGMARARELGCFSCHGELGRAGIPIPGADEGVPQWSGGVWMMYVKDDDAVRRYIVEGSPRQEHEEATAGEPEVGRTRPPDAGAAIEMPAYGDVIGEADLRDLVATFKVLSGMVAPARGTPARAGLETARERGCFSCHGPAGSGGLPNPGSLTGFVPGWYGPDFDDLVRDREEFDGWIREGTIPRLSRHPVARFYMGRQRLAMPVYSQLTQADLDGLWAYAQWLEETDGGHRGEIASW